MFGYLAADSTRAMQDQMQMSGAGMPPDPAKAFKVSKVLMEYTMMSINFSINALIFFSSLFTWCNNILGGVKP